MDADFHVSYVRYWFCILGSGFRCCPTGCFTSVIPLVIGGPAICGVRPSLSSVDPPLWPTFILSMLPNGLVLTQILVLFEL